MTQKQQAALQALMATNTRKAAAEMAGIDEKTLRSYLADDEFQREYRRACDELVDSITHDLRMSLTPMMQVMRDICNDENESSSARVAATRTMFEYSLRYGEVSDILKRLEAAENAIGKQG